MLWDLLLGPGKCITLLVFSIFFEPYLAMALHACNACANLALLALNIQLGPKQRNKGGVPAAVRMHDSCRSFPVFLVYRFLFCLAEWSDDCRLTRSPLFLYLRCMSSWVVGLWRKEGGWCVYYLWPRACSTGRCETKTRDLYSGTDMHDLEAMRMHVHERLEGLFLSLALLDRYWIYCHSRLCCSRCKSIAFWTNPEDVIACDQHKR
jgi:hypothetical protein